MLFNAITDSNEKLSQARRMMAEGIKLLKKAQLDSEEMYLSEQKEPIEILGYSNQKDGQL